MARIRGIKPEFWTDPKVVSISPMARLLFIGMWNFALCDNGHVAEEPVRLKLQILPIDNADVPELITELIDVGLITRIDAAATDQTFLHVKGLSKHQPADRRWSSRCVACTPIDKDKTPTSSPEAQGNSNELNRDHSEVEVEVEVDKRMRIDKASMRDSEAEFEEFWKHYPLKKAKGQAEKAFRTARKITDLPTLIAAVKAYKQVADPKYFAYGSTWLNGKRWLDEDIAPATSASIEDWLRECWTKHDTRAITDRCGLEFESPDIPEDVTDVRAFALQARRDWITTNHDEIVTRILRKEAS